MPRRVTRKSESSGSSSSKAIATAARRRLAHLLLVLVGIWVISTGLVLFLLWRHAKVETSRSPTAQQNSAGRLSAPGVPENPQSEDNLGAPDASLPKLQDILVRAHAWNPPIATGTPSPSDHRAALAVNPGDHVLGSHKADVTLVLFADLYCPYTLHTFEVLRDWLGEHPTAFRLVWRHRPLDIHPAAQQAARIAERVATRSGESAFWRFVFAVSELQGTASDAQLGELEEALQAKRPGVSESAANARGSVTLERDRLIALSYSIHATPTLYVNGLRLEGEVSRSHLEQMVSEERGEVQSLLDDSVPESQTYSMRVDENLLDLVRE